jgi:hypothetical protein
MDRAHFLQQVERLRDQGKSIRTIGAALDVNRGRVERALKMLALRRSDRLGEHGERKPPGIFVGRQHEMDALQTASEDALSGQGRLVMLGGEPGIGKTRTAQELATIAIQRGGRVLWGRCYTEHGAPPYWPWTQFSRTYIRDSGVGQLRADLWQWSEAMNQTLAQFFAKENISLVGANTQPMNPSEFVKMTSDASLRLAYALGRGAFEQYPDVEGVYIGAGPG